MVRAGAMRRITGWLPCGRLCQSLFWRRRGDRRSLRNQVMPSQRDKAMRFRALHESPGIFVIPNVWDGGSASVMAGLGFEALATSSAACAATLGKLDGEITREEALAHARMIVAVSAHPVAADLENGFGDSPETAAETIRLAAAAGLVGGSIEGASGDPRAPVYPPGQAGGGRAAPAGAGPPPHVPVKLHAP